VFQIGGNTFFDRKNKILMKIPEFRTSRIRIIVEFCGIPSGFPKQACCPYLIHSAPPLPFIIIHQNTMTTSSATPRVGLDVIADMIQDVNQGVCPVSASASIGG
jgi:hypothetical protein